MPLYIRGHKARSPPDDDNSRSHSVDYSSNEASPLQSPTNTRRIGTLQKHRSILLSATDLHARLTASKMDDHTPLLEADGWNRRKSRVRIATGSMTPRPRLSRHDSATISIRDMRPGTRRSSWGSRLIRTFTSDTLSRRKGMFDGAVNDANDRVWYDQFTSTDWVHDNIADAFRRKELRSRKDFRGRLRAFFDGAQGWILSALVGFLTACIAYVVDVSEAPVFDLKDGYCSEGWYKSEKTCCPQGSHQCEAWSSWSSIIKIEPLSEATVEFLVYLVLVVAFATVACLFTLITKTVVSSTYRISTFGENLGAIDHSVHSSLEDSPQSPKQASSGEVTATPMVYYSASGSGVAECKVILSGFVLHGFLGLKTLIVKTLGLIMSVASGLSVGKEGPFVHIATCVGNIACRLFDKYDHNDSKRREILSAAAASGLTVAFGAPIGGVLFSLEEASYFFPAKTLFRTFFCCITAALTLKFLNPYGTGKIVMFEIRYLSDWEFFEMVPFIVLGILGGAIGALFIKAARIWATTFRRIPTVKRWPLVEVMSVAAITGIIGYWNRYTNSAVAKLLFNLASPCDLSKFDESGLCPTDRSEIMNIVSTLFVGLIIKGFLTTITFGIKVPGGIYVPSMVCGGLLGRLVGHLVQWLVLTYPDAALFRVCAAHGSGTSCVTPGVYALIAAGATMCGVTRLSITLAIILFEITGSLDYVLPFSLSILVAKWTADAVEPLSIYDLLTNMNSYPFLDNKRKPIFTSDLSSLVPRIRPERLIDISMSPNVSAMSLRHKLGILHAAGELDGGLPVIRDDVLVGLIPAPDLEFALDNLPDEEDAQCLMAAPTRTPHDCESGGHGYTYGYAPGLCGDEEGGLGDDGFLTATVVDPTDFTPYVDPAPVALDVRSPMDLVYECFAKLGLRYVCVLRDGVFAGMVHRKVFVKYVRELEEAEGGVLWG